METHLFLFTSQFTARKASYGARQLLRPNQRVDALGAHPGERDMESRRKKISGKEVQGYIRLYIE